MYMLILILVEPLCHIRASCSKWSFRQRLNNLYSVHITILMITGNATPESARLMQVSWLREVDQLLQKE